MKQTRFESGITLFLLITLLDNLIMKHSRRGFIQKSSLGLAGFIFFSTTPSVFGNIFASQSIEEMLAEASNLKKSKDYLQAENLYRSIIEHYPTDKRAYFGLRKTFLVQDKFLEAVRLFENVLQNYPRDPIFLNQLAKEYTSISLGNSKVVEQLNYNFSLVDKARELYQLAKENSSNSDIGVAFMRSASTEENPSTSNNSDVGLKKIEIIIDNQLNQIDARDNLKAKELLLSNRSVSRSYEINLSTELLIARLNELKVKPKNIQRDKFIKRTYRELIYKLFKDKDYTRSYQYANELYTFDKKDVYSLNLYKKACLRSKRYDTMESLTKENDDVQKTNWSRIGYIKALILRYEKSNVGNLTTINNLLNSFETTYKITPSILIEINYLKAKFYTLKKDYNALKSLLNTLSDNFIGTRNSHNLVRYMAAFSDYYIGIGKKNEAITLINSFLLNSTRDYIVTEELSNKILAVSALKSYSISDYAHQKEIINLKRRIQAT